MSLPFFHDGIIKGEPRYGKISLSWLGKTRGSEGSPGTKFVHMGLLTLPREASQRLQEIARPVLSTFVIAIVI